MEGQLVCCGDDDGFLEIFDLDKNWSVRVYRAQRDRIGCIELANRNMLITGSKDHNIHIHDLRQSQPIVAELKTHKGEVCGLSFKDNYLASGGNDNKVAIWDLRKGKLIG